MNKALLICLILLLIEGIAGFRVFPRKARAQENGIIVEGADYVSTNTTEYSADLINITGRVTARIILEYCASICELGLQESEDLNNVTISPRIMVEYAEWIFSCNLCNVTPPDIPPRIIVEYADWISTTDLKRPLLPHDVAVIDVTCCKSVVGQGHLLPINITVGNEGFYNETFTVTAYYNDTAITLPSGENYTIMNLASGENYTTITFAWNTTGFAKGNYSISAIAWPVPGETDTADNEYVDGWVVVTIAGDIDGDGDVDYRDLFILARAYGSSVGQPSYIANADLDCNGKIDYKDLFHLARNYGKNAYKD